ncbi:ferric iron reductase [Salinisphaera dokdonensis CL-ES53]|uniref:Ferric iron reductase n=1 Tax=Salinisphaera dokdonensis CL-ES53 TaxID=1304272 RepID=A0ABV2B4S0_9GAMM
MFARHFHDHLESFGDALVADAPRDTVVTSGALLRDPDAFADQLAAFKIDRGCHDDRAAASQWSKWFFSRLIIPAAVVQLATDQRLVCEWADLDIGWQADATPRCFVVQESHFLSGDGADLAGLIDTLLCPFVDALTGYCRLSARVFWSNASMYYDWVVGELTRQGRIPAERVATAAALLNTPTRPDGGFNPFVRAHRDCKPGALDGDDAPIARCRRLCCMRDLDPKWGLCANCPRAVHYGRASHAAASH